MWMGYINISLGFPGGSDGKEPAYRVGDMGSIPELGWYPGEGNGYQFLPEEFHGMKSLVGYSPSGCKELDTTELLHNS